MKKIKKVAFAMIALAVLVVPFSSKVFAASETRYTSYLEMAPRTILTGKEYTYYQGNYKITLYPTSFYNHPYCNMYIDLYRKDLIGKTFLAGDLENMTTTGYGYTYFRGNHGPCNAFYYFETEYGGIMADPVYMYSYD